MEPGPTSRKSRRLSIGATTSAVSVVVITRDRPADLERCLTSIQSQHFGNFELVVVDQSSTVASAELVCRLAEADPRIHYIQDTGKGAARARNLGVTATRGDVIVFTDDDCEADPEWLRTLVVVLCDDPGAGLAFGSVLPAPYDPTNGFIVCFTPTREVRLTGRLAKLFDAGISANLALRRHVWQATGGFDEMLGPGSYFPCAEDLDLTYRVLARGFAVRHVPQSRVTHHGLRELRSAGGLINGTYVAIGAAYMKHVRLRDVTGLALLGYEIGRASLNILQHLWMRRGPFGFGRLRGLIVGIFRSYELQVEPRNAMYHQPS